MSEINGTLVAVLPPEGYVVDFDNPQRNSVLGAYVVSGIGMGLALFFLFQRLFVKAVAEDEAELTAAWTVLLIIAWLGSVAIQGLVLLYVIPTCLSKVVILMFLLEINSSQKWYRWAVFVTMFVVVCSNLGIFFASIFSCTPVRKSWDLAFPADVGSCIDRPAMFQATAGLGVATDVMIIAIPIPTVLGLQLSTKKKAALLCLFLVGSATVITSMIRLAFLVLELDNIDFTWGGGRILIWICIEANLLIICACLSTLRHFFKTVAPRFLTSTRGTTSGRSKTANASGLELRTIGGTTRSGNRGPYTQFDEPFTTTAHVEAGAKWHRDGKSRSLDGKSINDDERSDKGILQTTTTTVDYSDSYKV
ncbi:hypothetical protein F66182_4528 [Fusarium sp. NRRL 66182]|nr:hypothetical protein F66182_4528 [Fusarium sp. NRRL 66182]